MRTLEEFRVFRAETLEPELQPIREAVSRGWRLIWKTLGAFCLLTPLVFGVALLWSRAFESALIAAGVCAVVGVLALVAEYSSLSSKRRAAFKGSIAGRIVSFVDPDLAYSPDGYMPETLFRACGIYTQGVDRYSGEDLVKGSFNGVKLAFSEIHAEYKTTTTDSKGRTTTHWHTIFKGVLMMADFNKDFKTRTIVVPDGAERIFGSYLGKLLQGMNFSRDGSLVKLEDPVFEKAFAVYADDQVEARYILTPALMERIMGLRSRFGEGLALSFLGSNVFLCIPMDKPLLEPGSALERPELLDEVFQDVCALAGVVDDLNLTTRIWTKR